MNAKITHVAVARTALATVVCVGAVWLASGPLRIQHTTQRYTVPGGMTPVTSIAKPPARQTALDPRLARIVAQVAANAAAQRAHSLLLQSMHKSKTPVTMAMRDH